MKKVDPLKFQGVHIFLMHGNEREFGLRWKILNNFMHFNSVTVKVKITKSRAENKSESKIFKIIHSDDSFN